MKRSIAAAILVALAFLPIAAAQAQEKAPEPSLIELWQKSGHGNSQSSAFTHWNDEGEIPVNCAACHSGEGFRAFHGLDGSTPGGVDQPIATGGVVDCATCHEDGIKEIATIRFPSGAEITPPRGTATCLTCHQGRAAGNSVDQQTANMVDDEVNVELAFVNPHYAVAAATLFGSQVKGGYEYPGQDYSGQFAHVDAFSSCIDCHDPHSTQVKELSCTSCHEGETLRTIRTSKTDFDGDGDVTTGIYSEISSLKAKLLLAIETYAAERTETPITYASRYPYFFIADTELTYANRYNAWTPALLRAAYNYQFVTMDKGAYAHNPHYAVQVLHDSITDLAHRAPGINIELGPRP
ncbi:cytochrome c3 family protein [Maritalea mediterranea]|uniref:Cytochrome c3 family protein n=1 Tax=Maritalea mediterranea TaxID=2909667 RepID=A0ABS9E676_9HYPH|nr:cytochrome c3 family protein [Maritalea mediterranea]MCF4098375.1 cytochrome c3 family protein [Maritalea mediterranea]